MRQLGRLTRTPCWNADEVVHTVFKKKEIIQKIQSIFPETLINNGNINIVSIREYVKRSSDNLFLLEKILHPIVQEERKKILQLFRRQKRPLVFLEIPLFYETTKLKRQKKNIKVLLLKASLSIRKERFVNRKKGAIEILSLLEKRQLPMAYKKAKGGEVVNVSAASRVSFRNILREYKKIVL